MNSINLIGYYDEGLRLEPLLAVLAGIAPRIIACSGGIDSLLLATLAHRQSPTETMVAHAVSPAVPTEATERVKAWAKKEQWNLKIVSTGEFENESYLSNPANRCYYCKNSLYTSLELLMSEASGKILLSGANLDDLGEYRPGLIAAKENAVRHPYIEAKISKSMIRGIARFYEFPFSELPASPCLASRIYTGTRVTTERLKAIEAAEQFVREHTSIEVVRCRIKESRMLIEVQAHDRPKISVSLVTELKHLIDKQAITLEQVTLDPKPYQPGRAFVVTPS